MDRCKEASYTMRFIALSLLLSAQLFAAQVDNILARGRALFGQEQPAKALTLLNEYLRDNPGDADARVLLGLICSWDKRYDEGRIAFATVLEADADYKDAVLGLVNLEMWSGNAQRAEEVAQAGLRLRPADADYQAALAKVKASRASAHVTLAPAQEGVEQAWETGVNQSTIWFSDKRSTWHETSATVSKNTPLGWITARFSHASWFGTGSNLIEVESYPRIRPGTYGYLAGAFSPDAGLYAHRRAGGEIFQSFPKGFEGSAGIRYYRFSSDSLLYTGSVAKYFGNWWVLGRTFISPDAVVGLSKSLQIQARHYSGDADHFIGLRFGMGASPFEVRSVNEVDVQRSTSVAVESLWKFKNGLRFRINTGVARQTRRLFVGPLWQIQADGTLYYAF